MDRTFATSNRQDELTLDWSPELESDEGEAKIFMPFVLCVREEKPNFSSFCMLGIDSPHLKDTRAYYTYHALPVVPSGLAPVNCFADFEISRDGLTISDDDILRAVRNFCEAAKRILEGFTGKKAVITIGDASRREKVSFHVIVSVPDFDGTASMFINLDDCEAFMYCVIAELDAADSDIIEKTIDWQVYVQGSLRTFESQKAGAGAETVFRYIEFPDAYDKRHASYHTLPLLGDAHSLRNLNGAPWVYVNPIAVPREVKAAFAAKRKTREKSHKHVLKDTDLPLTFADVRVEAQKQVHEESRSQHSLKLLFSIANILSSHAGMELDPTRISQRGPKFFFSLKNKECKCCPYRCSETGRQLKQSRAPLPSRNCVHPWKARGELLGHKSNSPYIQFEFGDSNFCQRFWVRCHKPDCRELALSSGFLFPELEIPAEHAIFIDNALLSIKQNIFTPVTTSDFVSALGL